MARVCASCRSRRMRATTRRGGDCRQRQQDEWPARRPAAPRSGTGRARPAAVPAAAVTCEGGAGVATTAGTGGGGAAAGPAARGGSGRKRSGLDGTGGAELEEADSGWPRLGGGRRWAVPGPGAAVGPVRPLVTGLTYDWRLAARAPPRPAVAGKTGTESRTGGGRVAESISGGTTALSTSSNPPRFGRGSAAGRLCSADCSPGGGSPGCCCAAAGVGCGQHRHKATVAMRRR